MPMPSSAWVRNVLVQLKVWRIVGFVSSVTGLLFYALSLSFKHVVGQWRILKVSLYGAVSLTILCVMLFARKCSNKHHNLLLKAHMGVLALMLTSLYSFFGDKDNNSNDNSNNNGNKPDVFGLISNASFALMSLCLSKQIDLGFEAELVSFYLGCLTIQLMNINFAFALVAAALCYSLFILRSYSDSNSQIGDAEIGGAGHVELVAIAIEGKEMMDVEVDQIRQLYPKLGIQIVEGEKLLLYPQDLEAKLTEAMGEEGFGKENCFQVFCGWRRQYLDEKLLLKDLMMINVEEIHKVPLKYLKDQIERWVSGFSDTFMTLFPNERLLCDRIFSGQKFLHVPDTHLTISKNLTPINYADLSFMEICHEPAIRLLNFANAVAGTTRSPERLFGILTVFETLNSLKPKLESMFSEQCSVVLWNEAIVILKKLKEAIRLVFMEMENLIRQDPARVAVPGGGLHPTNRHVMNFLCAACEFQKLLEIAFEDHDEGSDSSLSLQVGQILELLESNLKANSKKLYKESSLCSIFMMNNWRYMVHKVKKCDRLGNVLGDEWAHIHIAKMRHYLVNYQRSSWDQVLSMLNIENYDGKLFEVVKLLFEEICEVQSTWVVLDEQLRDVMKSSLKKILLPAFEGFMARFQNRVEPGGGVDMDEDFGAKDVVALIDKLFQGKDEHRIPRINQPIIWTVVVPSTQDFHEWRKYGEKTILDPAYPRKYYRCIYKNDQGCQARKHVQQIQENPKMYTATYSGFHTCNVLSMLLKPPQILNNTSVLVGKH